MKLKVSQAAEVRLGRQRAPQFEEGDHLVPYLRSANIGPHGIDLGDVKRMNFTPAEQTIFALKPGDVLVTEGSGSRDAVGASAVWEQDLPEAMCFQNTLLRIRPRSGVTEGRFIAWWARHAHASGQMAEAATGANILHLGSDGLKQLTLEVPDLSTQLAIADFLDNQVPKIDNILAARRNQIRLQDEELSSQMNALLMSAALPRRPLQAFTDPTRPIQYGIVLPGPDFEGGVPIIKGGDIGSGRLARLELNRTDPEIESAYRRSRVRPGDIVISIRGSFGEVAMVPAELLTANLTQDSARIAASNCDPDWLEQVLLTPTVQSDLERRATGSTVRGVNISELRRVEIPAPDLAVQQELGRVARELREGTQIHRSLLLRSIGLLTEYKQSLIAAAVTGKLDVTTASTKVSA